MDSKGNRLVEERRTDQKWNEPHVPPRVEDVADDDHRQAPPWRVGERRPVERQDDQEEDREGDGGKEHLFSGCDLGYGTATGKLFLYR